MADRGFPEDFDDIGTAIVDSDYLVVNKKKSLASRVWTYVSGKITAQTDYVTNAMLRVGAGLSVVGRSSGVPGVLGDIVASNSDEVLREKTGVLGFGQVATGGIEDGAITQVKIANAAVTEAKLSAALQTTLGALVDTADPLSVFPSYQTIGVTSRYTDFDTTSVGNYPYTTFGSGLGNAQNWYSAFAGRKGLITLECGTTTTGQYYVGSSTAAIAFGFGAHRWRADGFVPSASGGTDTFTVRAGFIDAAGGECVDGAYFRYTHSVNGGRWQCVTRSNSIETATDSGVAGQSVAIQSFEIEVNAAASSVAFWINGTLVQTHTTDIPSGTTRATGVGVSITKSAGTTNRSVVLDLMGDRFERTTAI